MSRVTDDPNDPRLKPYRGKGHDEAAVPQQDAYLVLPEADRAKGFLRPYRDSYQHINCGFTTSMSRSIAETYARDPWFYDGTYCAHCQRHRPLSEFIWIPSGESMDPRLWPDELMQEVVKLRKERNG